MIQAAAARIAAVKPGGRRAVLQEIIGPKADMRRRESKTVLHQRALLITRLREAQLWP